MKGQQRGEKMETDMNGLLNPESQCIGTLDCTLNVLFVEGATLNAVGEFG